MMKFTTRYSYKPTEGIVNEEESKTYQECKDDCDINILYRRYLSKGLTPPNIQQLEQRYADISKASTYEETLNVQEDVKIMFEELPSDIRESCDYNIDTFIELISSSFEDKNVKELQKDVLNRLGMLERVEEIKELDNALEASKIPDVEKPHQTTIQEALEEK